jgi:hypothetical protein
MAHCHANDAALAWFTSMCTIKRLQRWMVDLGWATDTWMGFASVGRQFAHQVRTCLFICYSTKTLSTHYRQMNVNVSIVYRSLQRNSQTTIHSYLSEIITSQQAVYFLVIHQRIHIRLFVCTRIQRDRYDENNISKT